MNPTLARLRRLLVMVPWLLDHPGTAVEDVAERFEVAPADVLDDLDVLGYCGLPGYGGGDLIQATVSGGQVVVRMAEFFARPLALSMREGLALLLAARATRDSGILDDGPPTVIEPAGPAPLDSAIAKLEQHLGGRAGLPVALDVQAGGADLLHRLMPAVADPRVVQITYRSASKGQTTTREVEPWALRSTQGSWYLQGFCRSAGEGRAFRLDRIRGLVVTDEAAPPRPAQPPRPPIYQPSPEDPTVVVDVDASAAWVCDQVVLTAREARSDGGLRLTFQVATMEWAAALLLRLGAHATVVTPASLDGLVRDRAGAVLARYGRD